MKHMIETDKAPLPSGTYSQAIRVGNTVYLSGQIAKHPQTAQMVNDSFHAEAKQVLDNLSAVAVAAGGGLDDMVKLTIFLTDLKNFSEINSLMQNYFSTPYPARSTFQVAALPAGAQIEIEAVMVLPG